MSERIRGDRTPGSVLRFSGQKEFFRTLKFKLSWTFPKILENGDLSKDLIS